MNDAQPANILVRTPNWVGDAVMALPFLAGLRHCAPASRIICLCRSALAPLFEDVGAVDRVVSLDESKGRSGIASVRHNAAMLRTEKCDLAFCLPASFGSALMLWLAGIPRRVGHAAEGRRVFLTDSLPYGKNGGRPHRADGYQALLRLVWPDAPVKTKLMFVPGRRTLSPADRIWAKNNLASSGPVLALAPGAAQPNKMWGLDRFAVIAQRWIDQVHGPVLIVGGPAEVKRARELQALTGRSSVIDLTNTGTLTLAAEIIRRTDAFLGNDSGLAHLAAAVGTPTVTISGPGDPTEVAPYTDRAVTIKHPLDCSPCYKNYCWRQDQPLACLTEIGSDEVWEKLLLLRRDG